jgi:hypothetical protein
MDDEVESRASGHVTASEPFLNREADSEATEAYYSMWTMSYLYLNLKPVPWVTDLPTTSSIATKKSAIQCHL